MKTDELIAMLANGADAVEPNALGRRYATALGWGAIGATLLMIITLGVRPDFADAARLPMFWVKFAFVASVAAAGLVVAARLSRPGVRLGLSPLALVAPVLALWILAAVVLADALAAERTGLVLGQSWKACPFVIAGLSVPVFVAALWAMKGLAPTRLCLAGFAAGLLAGGVGATVYAFYCTEMAAPFLGVWYVLGMSIPAAVGAVIGPWVLRW